MQQKVEQKKIPYLYFSFSHEERESAIHFLLESILKARDQSLGIGRSRGFDEDVNIYLAHLLFAVTLPEYHDMADPFLSDQPEQIFEWVRDTDDPMLRYFIFKVNADNLLVQSTVFNPDPELTQRFFLKKGKKEEPAEISLATTLYYNHASRCHEGLHEKKTGVGEVLDKIAADLPLYQKVLASVRVDYFRLIDCFRDQAFQNFNAQVAGYEKQYLKGMKMEQFLDAYQQWLLHRAPDQKKRVLYLSRELQTLDPEFRFDSTQLE
ncbi:MAG: hypothetical protein KTQ49_06860 [Candidatus Omnitrophica bacterium]|nr:hypothetical protein [Candidatus Omnitrophota bacterium]